MRPFGAVVHAEEARGRGGQPIEQAQRNSHVLGEAGEEVEQRHDLLALGADPALERARDEAVFELHVLVPELPLPQDLRGGAGAAYMAVCACAVCVSRCVGACDRRAGASVRVRGYYMRV